MTTSIIVHPNGEYEVRDIDVDLSTIQGLVGGYLEAVILTGSICMYCNEHGKLNGLPRSALATAIVDHYRPRFSAYDVIVGPVVLLGRRGDKEQDVPQEAIDLVERMTGVAAGRSQSRKGEE